MSQIVDAWITTGVRTLEAGAIEKVQEDITHAGVGQRLTGGRYKESTARSSHVPARNEIRVERLPHRLMQRQ